MRRRPWILLLAVALVSTPVGAANHQQALTCFKRAMKLKGAPNDPMVLFKKEQLYRRAIELWPEFPEAHNNLGDVYERQGRFKEAIAEYKEATRLDPDAACPCFGLGDVYYKTGRYKEAMAWYKKGLRLDPNDRFTQKRLEALEDLVKGNVVKAGTIVAALGTGTRGVGAKVSLTFGEGLIPFDFNRADIRPDARAQLDEIGKALRTLTGVKAKDIAVVEKPGNCFEIAGHTDPRGTDAYNLKLSQRRAQAVVDYLARNFGIPRDRLIAKGYGERQPLCTEGTEACYALDRRVEIIRRIQVAQAGDGHTRGVSSQAPLPVLRTQTGALADKRLAVEAGFFYQKGPGEPIYPLEGKVSLRSRKDRYFMFFRPLQDCYCYLLQEDSRGSLDLLFPEEGKDGFVPKASDHWVPAFGSAFTLDANKGEEKLYLLVSAQSIKTELEGLSLKDQAKRAVRAFKTRAIYIVKAPRPATPVPSSALSQASQQTSHGLDRFLERIEGEGAWVKVVRFEHE